MDKILHEHVKIDWLYLECFYQIRKPQRHACLKLEISNYFWNMSFLYKMHHSLIKFETAQKMFANFLVSKVTKFENF